MQPGLYQGSVLHTRLRPRTHRLRYSVFTLLLDLDAPAAGLRLLSHNRFNLMSFHDRDHGPGDGRPLKPWLAETLAGHGITAPLGKVYLLSFPRILGYVFNPISVYFCHDPDGGLIAVLYEVNNTFGQRHSYLVPLANGSRKSDGPLTHSADKLLYVSPFNDVSGHYDFSLDLPDETLGLRIRQMDKDGPLLFASLTADRQPLSDRSLMRAFLLYPLLTLKVMGAIHWEALKLWRKGMRLAARPAPPEKPVSLGRP